MDTQSFTHKISALAVPKQFQKLCDLQSSLMDTQKLALQILSSCTDRNTSPSWIYVLQNIRRLWFFQRPLMSRDSLSAISCNPGIKYDLQNGWNIQCLFLDPTTKAEKNQQSWVQTFPQYCRHTYAWYYAPWDNCCYLCMTSPNKSSKIVEIPNLCQRGLGRNSINSTAFIIHILAEVD